MMLKLFENSLDIIQALREEFLIIDDLTEDDIQDLQKDLGSDWQSKIKQIIPQHEGFEYDAE